jgi:hypothetical protein
VNERAKQILAQLEQEHVDETGRPKIAITGKKKRRGDLQLTLFAAPEHPLVEELRRLDVAHLTPMGALELLNQWQGKVGIGTGRGEAKSGRQPRSDESTPQPRSGDRQRPPA